MKNYPEIAKLINKAAKENDVMNAVQSLVVKLNIRIPENLDGAIRVQFFKWNGMAEQDRTELLFELIEKSFNFTPDTDSYTA